VNILWIDDDEDLLEPQRRNLEEAGYRIKICDGVDSAYSALRDRSHTFKGIILDVMLSPGALLANESVSGGLRTGIVFLERLQREKLLKECRLFVFSHRGFLPDSEHVNSLGYKYHLKQDHMGAKIVNLVRAEFGRV
jgi:CheY-like chemotaxis protein